MKKKKKCGKRAAGDASGQCPPTAIKKKKKKGGLHHPPPEAANRWRRDRLTRHQGSRQQSGPFFKSVEPLLSCRPVAFAKPLRASSFVQVTC